MAGAGERIPREVLLYEIARALRASFPDRAERLLRELERRLARDVPETPRVMTASTSLQGEHDPRDIADAVIALVDNVERRSANPRWRWGVDATFDRPARELLLEVRATPRDRSRR